jgi:predicted transcriptional regulator
MTEKQKADLHSLIINNWDISMAVVLRRLIQYVLKINYQEMEAFFRHYQMTRKMSGSRETKIYKTSIRLIHRDWLKFRELADQWGRSPAFIVSMLTELFSSGFIPKESIWK